MPGATTQDRQEAWQGSLTLLTLSLHPEASRWDNADVLKASGPHTERVIAPGREHRAAALLTRTLPDEKALRTVKYNEISVEVRAVV